MIYRDNFLTKRPEPGPDVAPPTGRLSSVSRLSRTDALTFGPYRAVAADAPDFIPYESPACLGATCTWRLATVQDHSTWSVDGSVGTAVRILCDSSVAWRLRFSNSSLTFVKGEIASLCFAEDVGRLLGVSAKLVICLKCLSSQISEHLSEFLIG